MPQVSSLSWTFISLKFIMIVLVMLLSFYYIQFSMLKKINSKNLKFFHLI